LLWLSEICWLLPPFLIGYKFVLVVFIIAGRGWLVNIFLEGLLLASGCQLAWAPFQNLGGPKWNF
jgi:hypothetical protein